MKGRFWFLVKDELFVSSFPELFDFLYCFVDKFGKVYTFLSLSLSPLQHSRRLLAFINDYLELEYWKLLKSDTYPCGKALLMD